MEDKDMQFVERLRRFKAAPPSAALKERILRDAGREMESRKDEASPAQVRFCMRLILASAAIFLATLFAGIILGFLAEGPEMAEAPKRAAKGSDLDSIYAGRLDFISGIKPVQPEFKLDEHLKRIRDFCDEKS